MSQPAGVTGSDAVPAEGAADAAATAPTRGLPAGTRVLLDPRVRTHGSRLVTGGAPWGLVRLSAPAADFLRRLAAAGPAGLVPSDETELATADLLTARGIVHAAPRPSDARGRVTVVIPAHDRPALLARCLAGLTDVDVVVVDDASSDAASIRAVAERYANVRLLRHRTNQGPGAARNTGLTAVDTDLVAFLDSDCTVHPGWLDGLVGHFDDPRVGLVAPRVRPRPVSHAPLLARHEDARSALDMGGKRELVRHGAPLGFLPSAALVVRRAALGGAGFAPQMRVGEDVDLVWRLIDAGWQARYDPAVVVHHEMRLHPLEWARRRYDYGTSAAALDVRHPGRLAPARVSGWNAAVLALALLRRPRAAAVVAGASAVMLGRHLRTVDPPPSLAASVVAKGLVADAVALGHALRREWWPLGWAALFAARRSRVAAAGALAMLAPLALEHARQRPDVDPLRYGALRLVEDAAYGSGVLASATRHWRPRALLPEVRWPRGRGSRTDRGH